VGAELVSGSERMGPFYDVFSACSAQSGHAGVFAALSHNPTEVCPDDTMPRGGPGHDGELLGGALNLFLETLCIARVAVPH